MFVLLNVLHFGYNLLVSFHTEILIKIFLRLPRFSSTVCIILQEKLYNLEYLLL